MAASDSDKARKIPTESAVVQHSARPQWGSAVMAWARDDKRAYQFEDGEVRVFKESYLHLLKTVESRGDEPTAVERRLRQEAHLASERRVAQKEARRAGRPMVTMEEQIRRFQNEYPGGFADATWKSDLRGIGASRRLKRFRDSAIEEAQTLLGAEVLTSFVDGHQFDEIWQRAMQVMRGTDLVTPRQIALAKDLDEAGRRTFAQAQVDLLHGDEALEARLDKYVLALGPRDTSWPLATVTMALVHPKEQVCVRPTAFRNQAHWMQPGLTYEPRPTGMRYLAWRGLAQRVEKRLVTAGLAPRDLVDIYDFIRLTAK